MIFYRYDDCSIPRPLSISVTPPPGAPLRPHTASDFRTRRYHRSNVHNRSLTDNQDYHHKDNKIIGNDKKVSPNFNEEKEASLTANNELLTARTKLVHSRRVYRTPFPSNQPIQS